MWRGRIRTRQYHRVAEDLGFQYLGETLPSSLNLSRASFWDEWDSAQNVIVGSFKDIETFVFYFHAIPGQGSNVPITLLGSSGFSAQLAGTLGLPLPMHSLATEL